MKDHFGRMFAACEPVVIHLEHEFTAELVLAAIFELSL
jgi:hypothetical protein